MSTQKISDGGQNRHFSGLVKSVEKSIESLESYQMQPDGVFGSTATIKSGEVTLKSSDLDFEFTVEFDDDMEANEAEIIVYNLSSNTVKKLKYHQKITIEAGYTGDTGLVFVGYITKIKSKKDGVDRAVTINCIDDFSTHKIKETTFAKKSKASYILKSLLKKTKMPIAVFDMRRDYTYDKEQKVDGDLMAAIKKYSQVCGVSTYIKNGKIYSRYIKKGDDIRFTVEESTGLIGSPSAYQEKINAEKYKDVINGYEVEMLLQHRMTAGAIVTLKSQFANGKFRVSSGKHKFNQDECTTKVKMY